MRKFFENALRRIDRDHLEQMLLAKVPDLPQRLRDNLGLVTFDGLVSLLAVQLEKEILSKVEDGFMIYVKKGEPLIYCLTAKEIVTRTLDQELGEDQETKELCLEIPAFLKDKNISDLSASDSEELELIRKKAHNAIISNHPQVSESFAGFQLDSDQNNILLRINIMQTFEFDNLTEFGQELEKKGCPITQLIISMLSDPE